MTPDTAARIQRLIRWVTELTSYEHHYSPGHRSTVLDSQLIDDTRALAAAAHSVLGTGPGPVQVEADIRAVLGLIGNDPEAYRDDDTTPADRDLTGG